jgi:dynein heavy chain
MNMFNEFSWLLESNPDDYVEAIVLADSNKAPHQRQAEFKVELSKLETAVRRLATLSFKEENFGLVQLSSEAVKHNLISKAIELRNAIAQVILDDCRQQNIAVLGTYTDILQRIAVKPTSERELADLRTFIEQAKSRTVVEMQGIVALVRGSHSMLESFRVPLPIDDVSLSWSTLEYPAKVEHAGKEVEIQLEGEKIRMMDRLSLQKDQFEKLIEQTGKDIKAAKLLSDYSERERVVETINQLKDGIDHSKEKANDFNMREKVFGFVPTDYYVLDKMLEELQPFYKLWNMVSDFHNSKRDWLEGEFKELEGTKIEEAVTDWWKTSYKLVKSLEEEFPGASSAANKLREETTDFRKNLPVVQSLASKALKERHWERLSELLGEEVNPQDGLTLQRLLDLDAASHIEKIQEVTIAAEKEYNLERTLNAMKKEWESLEFEVKAYKDSGTFIVGGIDDIITLLDDHIVKTQTMRGSPYIRPIEAETKDWEHKLKYAQGFLDEVIGCQRSWMYLEPIFGSEDIIRQLPTEARRFQGVDQLWRKTLADVNSEIGRAHV